MSVLKRIITEHPLQAFSPRNFSGDPDARLFSYSAQQRQNAERLRDDVADYPLFFPEPLPEPDDSWRTVELSQLIRFYNHPTRYLLRERLDIWPVEVDSELQQREPFELDNLERYQHRNRLLDAHLNGRDLNTLRAAERAAGWLPHGALGDALYEHTQQDIEQFGERLMQQPFQWLAPVEIDLVLGSFHLVGWLPRVDAERGCVFYRMGGLSGREVVTLLLSHLTLNALPLEGLPRNSAYITPNDALHFNHCDHAVETLTQLLEHYWRGLCEPVPFFPKTAYEFAKASWENKTDPMAKARNSWIGNQEYARGEGEDPYYQWVYGEHDPLDDEFAALALSIFAPIPSLTGGTKP